MHVIESSLLLSDYIRLVVVYEAARPSSFVITWLDFLKEVFVGVIDRLLVLSRSSLDR